MCVFEYLVWLTACHSFQLDWLTACMFLLDLDSPLLLFQINSVETGLPYCVVHWSGAAGDIWPTGPMLTLSYIYMSKVNTLELLQSCTKPSMWKISTGLYKKDVTPLITHWIYVFLALTHWYQFSWLFLPYFPARYTHTMTLMGTELIVSGGKASWGTSRCLSSVEAYTIDADQWAFLAPMRLCCAHKTATGKGKEGRLLFQYKDHLSRYGDSCY